jgi:hypothetical protein
VWIFLRFAADHLPAGAENPFWYSLVNSKTSGLTNLASALGSSPTNMLRDWAISVFMDDNGVGPAYRFQQPSWNLRSIITNGGASIAYPLLTRQLTDASPTTTTITGYSTAFLRFSVPAGQDALLAVTSGNQPLPSTVQLSVVRVR